MLPTGGEETPLGEMARELEDRRRAQAIVLTGRNTVLIIHHRELARRPWPDFRSSHTNADIPASDQRMTFARQIGVERRN